MLLVGIQIQTIDGCIACDARGLHGFARTWFRQEIPQGAGVPSPARLGQLHLSEQPVPTTTILHQQLPPDQERIIHYRGSQQSDNKRGKHLERSRGRHVLIPQRGEAVPRRTGGKSGVTGLTWHISFADWATPSEAPKAAEGRRPCTLRPRNRHLLSLDVSAKCCAPGLREGWSLPGVHFPTPPRPGLHLPFSEGRREPINIITSEIV